MVVPTSAATCWRSICGILLGILGVMTVGSLVAVATWGVCIVLLGDTSTTSHYSPSAFLLLKRLGWIFTVRRPILWGASTTFVMVTLFRVLAVVGGLGSVSVPATLWLHGWLMIITRRLLIVVVRVSLIVLRWTTLIQVEIISAAYWWLLTSLCRSTTLSFAASLNYVKLVIVVVLSWMLFSASISTTRLSWWLFSFPHFYNCLILIWSICTTSCTSSSASVSANSLWGCRYSLNNVDLVLTLLYLHV